MKHTDKATWINAGQKFLAWLLMAVCFVGIPAMLIFTAVDRYCQLVELELGKDLKMSLQQALRETSQGANISNYLAKNLDQQLHNFSINQASDSEIISWLENERKTLDNCLSYMIWDSAGTSIAHNTSADPQSPDWREVFSEISQACYGGRNSLRVTPKVKTDLSRVRRVLGPQYVSNMVEDSANPKTYSLCCIDSAFRRPLIWANSYANRLYLIFFDPAILKSDVGIKRLLENFARSRPQLFGLFRPDADVSGLWSPQPVVSPQNLLNRLKQLDHDATSNLEAENLLLATAFLTPDLRVFAGINKHYSKQERLIYPLAAASLFAGLMLPFLIYSWRITIAGKPGSISIRPRIAFIFFFACAIPFMAISIFAREHYAQKYDASLKETHRRSLVLLQNYDERIQSLWSKLEYGTTQHLQEWIKTMSGREIDEESNQKIVMVSRKLLAENFYIIASTSTIAGSYNGVERLSESLEQQERAGEEKKLNEFGKPVYRGSDTQNAQIANIIGKRIMSELNGIQRSTKEADRLELLFESVMQRSFDEITHSFIRAMGGLSPWGFGATLNLSLLNFLSTGADEKVDFMALMIWNSPRVQLSYLQKTINEVNRNPLGLRVIASNQLDSQFYPVDSEVPAELQNYFRRLTDQPTEEIEILKLNGQEYMVLGFNGKHLSRYKLLGLYPLDSLDRMIAGQRNDLVLFAIFCLILAAWLAQILARSFLNPLNSLQNAALAIEKRDFKHRIGDLGKDEFGEAAAIFDDVMVGLEELAVAKVVQESLFPQKALHLGGFRVYGKSLAMAELGGDYFDYFAVDDNNLAALLGDVAGHGVGAALIMAMAKAGIVKCRDQLKSPVKLLERLHELIYGSKTRKQKKIMTFQYITADCSSGRAVYANAGGCSPIFCSNGKAEEIALPGAALGAFKKANFQQREIAFKSGDLLVFYTDGIIETRNRDGVEFGYANFARLVEKSSGNDPEEVYNRICASYYQHIAGQQAQDDLTLVVICYI
ncbi:MAG: hypothetical protein CVV41_17950 [Candidatus Riflebacteria bacterium HGW-Riflebacteria-1]|jgi:HAMP domain-containing protein|nr:MAG: hypothetical protein CVV41_17950 [Candidatus Riflebacteria bacterium HGW-Riflebacteria-1]